MGDLFAERKQSMQSMADSTKSDMSQHEPYDQGPRKSMRSSYMFGVNRKTRQSLGAYTSLFARKLLPPLGFYREADKYAQLKIKFMDDPYKLDALDEMWEDYQKYQIRKRFRWPPSLICGKMFWTTGYYADYQKEHRATKLRRPGEDSSDEEFFDPAGMYMVAGQQGGEDDINVAEFEKYREAKRQNPKSAKFDLNQNKVKEIEKNPDNPGDSYLADRRPTTERLFDDTGKKGKKDKDKDKAGDKNKKTVAAAPPPPPPPAPPKEVEEVETIVEYTLIRDPNKKKRKSTGSKKNKKDDKSASVAVDTVDGMNLLEIENSKKVVTKRTSISVVDPMSGQKKTDIKETTELQDRQKKKK